MIYCIDVSTESDTALFEQKWHQAMAQQAQQAGFLSATLHRVYKQLNRDGYSLVSMVSWANHSVLDRARCQRHWFDYLSDEQFSRNNNRYHVVNHGQGPESGYQKDDIVITNPYRIRAEEAPRHAQMWEQSKQHMESRPGFVDAYFYQCRNPQGEYFYFSRARWRSEALFMKQFEGKDFKAIIASFEDIFAICFSEVVATVAAAETCTA